MRNIISLFIIALILSIGSDAKSQVINETPIDGLYEDMGTIDLKPTPFPNIRRADVMWQKRIWRVIDFREKMNQPFYFPVEAHGGWRSFFQIVIDGLKEGEITAYDISATDEFLAPITYNEVVARQTDSVHTVLSRPYPPYDDYDTVIYTAFDPTRVMQLRVKEDWYFDKQRSQMMVRIIGLCPVMMQDRDGEEIPQPLFWIYFPEARNVFAKAQMYNRFNDAEKRTYDEIFWKRMFSSYIYKETNVFDRRISEYAEGIDALFEAERIKTNLLNFEHELWEF